MVYKKCVITTEKDKIMK